MDTWGRTFQTKTSRVKPTWLVFIRGDLGKEFSKASQPAARGGEERARQVKPGNEKASSGLQPGLKRTGRF